ncbi:MAG TPA: hypothetical protein VFQ85_05850 [Mycobacteriales bacterium]|jgi:hypothetical protein|nr:hypothetical protein [Mycobacteriales bacterium]
MTPEELRAGLDRAVEPLRPGPESYERLRAGVERRRGAVRRYVLAAVTTAAVVAVGTAVALPRADAPAPPLRPAPVAPKPLPPDAERPMTFEEVVATRTAACAGRGGIAGVVAQGPPDKWLLDAQGPLTLSLFVREGTTIPAGLHVVVTAPDGGTATAMAKGLGAPSLRYPADFAGADTSRSGVYRADWQAADGTPVTCGAFFLAHPRGHVLPRAGRAADGDVDGDGVADVVEVLVDPPPRPGEPPTLRPGITWTLRADLSALGVRSVELFGGSGYGAGSGVADQTRGRALGVVDMDDDGYGDIPLDRRPTPGDGVHAYAHLVAGMLAVEDFHVASTGDRYGWGCADTTPAHPGREVYGTALTTRDGTVTSRRQTVLLRDGVLGYALTETRTWPEGDPAPAGWDAGFDCGGVHG